MVIVYSPAESSRLLYVLNEIFSRRLGISWTFTSNAKEYEGNSSPCKINYSDQVLPGLQVLPSGFLQELGIVPGFKPLTTRIEYHAVLFGNEGQLGFDIFSMAFWCLSRYEEYQPFSADQHGRFPASGSHFFEGGFVETPVLDIALEYFYRQAGLHAADKFAVYPTIDIDQAYKHRGKPFGIRILSLFKSLYQLQFDDAIESIAVSFEKTDPWDIYGKLSAILGQNQPRTRIFIHCGNRGPYDKAISLKYKPYQKLLNLLSESYSVGLHPSYAAGISAKGIAGEMKRLETATGSPISISRHHFLKIQIPETYQNLISAGIGHDYSMGFADSPGFRAGTAQSFHFYDLSRETTTALVIHPFCLMDVSLMRYRQMNPDEALEKSVLMKEVCRQYQIPFCVLLHNESLSCTGEWKGWEKVWEAWLE